MIDNEYHRDIPQTVKYYEGGSLPMKKEKGCTDILQSPRYSDKLTGQVTNKAAFYVGKRKNLNTNVYILILHEETLDMYSRN